MKRSFLAQSMTVEHTLLHFRLVGGRLTAQASTLDNVKVSCGAHSATHSAGQPIATFARKVRRLMREGDVTVQVTPEV
jgi:hypothetical protein